MRYGIGFKNFFIFYPISLYFKVKKQSLGWRYRQIPLPYIPDVRAGQIEQKLHLSNLMIYKKKKQLYVACEMRRKGIPKVRKWIRKDSFPY